MSDPSAERFELVNAAGYEAFEHIRARLDALGPVPFDEVFSAMVGATAVCLANALRPAIEAAPDRGSAADRLILSCMRQVRHLVDPIVTRTP